MKTTHASILETMEDKASQAPGGVEGCHHVILNDRSSLDGRVRPTLKALHLVQAHNGEKVEENSINLRATGHCRSDDWKL